MGNSRKKRDRKSSPNKVDFQDRREFLQTTGALLSTAVATKYGLMSRKANAQSLSDILSKTEDELYYRDRLPDFQTPFTNNENTQRVNLFDWNFIELIQSSQQGKFGTKGMPANFSKFHTVPDQYKDMPIAIIGAGAAGLAAGYELMKLGLKPVFYEMQKQNSPDGTEYSRPFGRAFSWDYGGNGKLDAAGAGWYPTTPLSPVSAMPNETNTHPWGRRIADLGAMRFPATHLTLRTYTDSIFRNDYYYGDKFDTPWAQFRDPGLYESANEPIKERGGVVKPSDDDVLVFDTVYNTKGIFKNRDSGKPPFPGAYSETDRVVAGTKLFSSNRAISNLATRYFDLLFGDTDPAKPYQGILTPILELYSKYTKSPTPQNAEAIGLAWSNLVQKYDQQSLREVLIEAGWKDLPAYDGEWTEFNISLLEMFGEIGTGTGPFAMFYYSSFVELLRIALQAADSAQDYFRGGAGYQLQPFLTHFTITGNSGTKTCLWNETLGQVITDKVVAIEKNFDGVAITTENNQKQTTTTYAAVIVTASPSSIRASEIFPEPGELMPSRVTSYIKRVRINNNSKLALNFPNISSEPYSGAFWMNRTLSRPDDPRDDIIVTTLTDKTIRQMYTFDNYHWATRVEDTGTFGSLLRSGILMLNYGWDYNAQSWTADDIESAARKAWKQMSDIYGFNDMIDPYLEWALDNNQVALIVWEKIDGFNAAWRMAQPGRGINYGDTDGEFVDQLSEFRTTQVFGMTSYNHEIKEYTGLFIAGEASASPGLSGWIEGSIQTGLQSVAGVVKFLNEAKPRDLRPIPPWGASFALHAHPGKFPLS